MRKIRNGLIALTIVAGAGVIVYTVLLNSEAKQGIKDAIGAVRTSYGRITQVIDNINGIVMDDDYLPNRDSALAQWAALGY